MPRGTYGPGPLNSWEDFSLYERCITRGLAGSILRVIYGNGNRIVQAPGVVVLSYENATMPGACTMRLPLP